MTVTFEDGIATSSGSVQVYYFDDVTREYISSGEEFVTIGLGIPAYACIKAPPESILGKAAVLTIDKWELVTDNRGKKEFSCASGAESVISYLGEVRDGFTLISPLTPYDVWDGKKWVTDVTAQKMALVAEAETQKEELISKATQEITVWQTKLLRGRKLSDADSASLDVWLDYIDALEAVDTSSVSAESPVEFPAPPAI